MSHRVKCTRLAFGTLLLGTLLLASGRMAAAAGAETHPRSGSAAGAGVADIAAEPSVLDRHLRSLGLAGLPGHPGRPGATGPRAASALHPLHGSAGCGIDPNGVYHCY
jgi:hypothetical protein